MKTNCLNCGKENPKHGMKTCCMKCKNELAGKACREKRNCLYCNQEFEVRKKDERRLCSEECRLKWQQLPENIERRINAAKEATKEKFGVENVFKLESIQQKSKETKIKKYDDENYNNPEKMLKTKAEKYGENYQKESTKNIKQKMLKDFGVDHPLKVPQFIKKQKETSLNRHGAENVSQVEEFKIKRTNTIKDKFGVENASQNEDIKKKKKQTSMDNFGVSHHLKDYGMFQKHLKAQYKILEYKDSGINYQGTYELHFLEKLEEKGLLNEVSIGKSYNYVYKEEEHVYHTDFFFRGENIEIKSGWTYNKNGKDKELENINKAKWKSFVDSGDKIKILFSKREIELFLEGII